MTRKDILETAEKMVCGQREQDYGTPENNFQVIADLWNVYLGYAKQDRKLDEFDVAVMMTLFKIGRVTSGTCTDDSLVDACGYLACAGEIVGKSNSTEDRHLTAEDEHQRRLTDILHMYGKYTSPDDPLPYIYCSDCPVGSGHHCTLIKSCDGRYDAAREILKMIDETKNAGEAGTGDGTDEEEFSWEDLIAVMKKYGTAEPGHELPYIRCDDCPVWWSGRCAINNSCDGHYDAARHILKTMKENKK